MKRSTRAFNDVYTGEHLNRIAFPMGGIGAGMICLEGTGALSHVSLRHQPEVFHEPRQFAALWVSGARYDAVVRLYHDQALIPLKTLDFDQGVNVTLGLPVVRTSPDHGTAFGIAGTGQASASAMIAAIRMAGQMALRREGASTGSTPAE